MWQCCFSLSLKFLKRLHRKKKTSLLFCPFISCISLCWFLRMPLIWWSCSVPSSPARHSLCATAIHKASSPTHRLSFPRTTIRSRCLMETAAQLSPCVWPSPPQKQKPCRPLWPSAAPRKPFPSPARTWPAICVRSSGTWSTQGSSAPWPRHGVLLERSAAWQRCTLSAPSVQLRVQKLGFSGPRTPGWTGSKPFELWWAIWKETPRRQRTRETNWRRAEGSWTARRVVEASQRTRTEGCRKAMLIRRRW